MLTVWLTPHIKTLRMGSLARNNFTFCPIKCFFFVLVLLALTGAALVQLDDMFRGLRRRGETRCRFGEGGKTHTKIGKLRAFFCLKKKKEKEREAISASCSGVQLVKSLWEGERSLCRGGVSGGAFCAVTTLPPPEQAATEPGGDQLAGHQPRSVSGVETAASKVVPTAPSSYLLVSNPIVMRPNTVVNRQQQALRSGSPQDGVRGAFHGRQRPLQDADGTAGVPIDQHLYYCRVLLMHYCC